MSDNNKQQTLTERLSEINGIEVIGNTYKKRTDNAEIAYDAKFNEIYITSDTFIGDSHYITNRLSDDTIVELFSNW